MFTNGVEGSISAYEWARKQLGYATEEAKEKTKEAKAALSDKAHSVSSSAQRSGSDVQGKVQGVVEQLKTKVHQAEGKLSKEANKAAAIAKHQSVQLSEGVEQLIWKAEDALSGKPIDSLPEATTSPGQPASSPPDAAQPRTNDEEVDVAASLKRASGVYDGPIPVGFEPPPGYVRPKPSAADKVKGIAAEKLAALKMEALPLIAPTVKELNANEPVLAHLASTIDNLASFLRSNPSAADKARDVLDTAKGDLTELAHHFDRVREEEQRKLEAQMDEQAREYTLKMLELEIAAQDKMENQEVGFRQYLDEEKAKMAHLFREKLDSELAVQREIINER